MDRNGRSQLFCQTNKPGRCKFRCSLAYRIDSNNAATVYVSCAGYWQTSQERPVFQSQLFGCDCHYHSCHYGFVSHISHSAWMLSSGLALSVRCETKPSCYWGPNFQVSNCFFILHSACFATPSMFSSPLSSCI